MSELLRIRIEFVETFAGTESIRAAAEDFGIASTRFDLHPTYGIFRRAAAWPRPLVMMAMNHV
jgi:hypothetical protein